jgi:hypothetical protein
MANELTTPPGASEFDDGFSNAPSQRRVGGGSYLKWNADDGWVDRDGIPAPSPLLVVRINELLRRWKDNVAHDIVEKPLPDRDELNAAIPRSEWEEGVDGKPRPPWAHYVVVYLVNLETAEKYVYAASTIGAHIAYEALREAVVTMRMLRGTRCMPVVELAARPMKTKFKMRERPHFQIIAWKTPGEDASAIPAQPPAPQLTGPTTAETPPAPPTHPSDKPDPISTGSAQPQRQAKPKPPVNATVSAMGDVKPATSAEILDDQIP